MKIKQTSLAVEAIKLERYAAICSAKTEAPKHTITFEQFLEYLKRLASDLNKIKCANVDTIIVIKDLPAITLTLAVPATSQGALITQDDAYCSSGMGTSNAPSGFSSVREQGAPPLDDSALLEAEEIARASARIAKGAIDVANTLVEKAEKETLTIESATPVFSASPDEYISRDAYCRARGAKQTLSFLGDERDLGGGHPIPNRLYSQASFSLSKCRVAISERKNCRYLRGNANDPEWQRLIEWSHFVVDELDGDIASDDMYLLHLAEASNLLVDVDVCISEKPSTKKRTLMLIRVRNRPEIKNAINERLEVIEE